MHVNKLGGRRLGSYLPQYHIRLGKYKWGTVQIFTFRDLRGTSGGRKINLYTYLLIMTPNRVIRIQAQHFIKQASSMVAELCKYIMNKATGPLGWRMEAQCLDT